MYKNSVRNTQSYRLGSMILLREFDKGYCAFVLRRGTKKKRNSEFIIEKETEQEGSAVVKIAKFFFISTFVLQ